MLPDSTTYPKPPGQERPYPKPTTIGKVSFKIPNHDLEGETAYEIWGKLGTSKPPLIVLHGGPGIPHRYLRTISLVQVDYGIPVIMYDQIGCGESTHFPNVDSAFWTPELFVAELDNLRQKLDIKTFHLLGFSWGGMLAAQYVVSTLPTGLQKLILSNTIAAVWRWEKNATRLLKTMPSDIQETVERCERENKLETPEYEAAMKEFNKRFQCRLGELPQEMKPADDGKEKDFTVAMTMFGPSDFDVRGTLKHWTVEKELKKLTPEVVPGGILLMNGYFEIGQDESMQPFFDEPSAKVKWVRFALSGHMPQLEETEKYIQALGAFLTT